MAFLSPLFLAGALAVAVPILVHLLKREPEVTVRFSAVRLLRTAPIERASRRHLRELLLLAARVAALVLLAFAFARPYFAVPSAAGSAGTVVALDTSASLSAPGQFERARMLARQAIDRAAGPVGLVTFADTATALSTLSGDRATLRAAIDRLRPGPGATSYRAAVDRAADLLHDRSGSVVVITDLQANGWRGGERASVPASVRVETVDVGAPPPNLAVVAARAVDGGVAASIRNGGDGPRQARVRLAVADGAPDARPTAGASSVVTVDAGEVASVTLPLSKGTWAAVSVDDDTGATEDNVRYVVLDGAAVPRALVISATGDLNRDAFYLAHAILAARGGPLSFAVDGIGGPGLQLWDRGRFDRYAVVVLLSTRGLDHHGRMLISEYLKAGGGLLIAAGPEVDGDVVAEFLGRTGFSLAPSTDGAGPGEAARTLVPLDSRHPILRGFAAQSAIGLVKFHRVTTVRAPGCTALARFTTGEAGIVECAVDGGRAVIVASDFDARGNDFPRRATFVPFVHEALRYLGDPRGSADYVVAHVPPGVRGEPGIVTTPGPLPRLASVNVDPDESNPSRMTPDAFQAAIAHVDANPEAASSTAADREARQPLWRYAVALMIVLLVVESTLAARTA